MQCYRLRMYFVALSDQLGGTVGMSTVIETVEARPIASKCTDSHVDPHI